MCMIPNGIAVMVVVGDGVSSPIHSLLRVLVLCGVELSVRGLLSEASGTGDLLWAAGGEEWYEAVLGGGQSCWERGLMSSCTKLEHISALEICSFRRGLWIIGFSILIYNSWCWELSYPLKIGASSGGVWWQWKCALFPNYGGQRLEDFNLLTIATKDYFR